MTMNVYLVTVSIVNGSPLNIEDKFITVNASADNEESAGRIGLISVINANTLLGPSTNKKGIVEHVANDLSFKLEKVEFWSIGRE